MSQTTMPGRPAPSADLRIAIKVDERGVTLYCNAAGLKAIADDLSWIAKSPAEGHFECHVRLHFDEAGEDKVRLVVDEGVRPYFEQFPEDAPADAEPVGFEVTFMQIADHEFAETK
jgi:hypothetical protein